MYNFFRKIKRKKYINRAIDPDEILLDSKNLPNFDQNQFEGRIEKPLGENVFTIISISFFCIGFLLIYRIWDLQITSGESYRTKSVNNSLKTEIIFSHRGEILDRNGLPLAWNEPGKNDSIIRNYSNNLGFSPIIGYVSKPTKDKNGNYYNTDMTGISGIEKTFNTSLQGENGKKLTETNALGKITSQSIISSATEGENITLSVDKRLNKILYRAMEEYSVKANYRGGASLIMDVDSGEILAISSFPEFDSSVISFGEATSTIKKYFTDSRNLFLNRPITGLYTPGSIVKPFVAVGVLTEKVIDPKKIIFSTGSISIPNQYDPKNPTIFKDWKALGAMDMRGALAWSSDVYFYKVGGGYKVAGQPSQTGIGIYNIEKYLRLFGFGQKTDINIGNENIGTIPNPEWKLKNFNGDPWRLGDTYHTAIGQYGVQVTPIQAVRATSAIANDGKLLTPTILKEANGKSTYTPLDIEPEVLKIVKEGMRQAVTSGTAQALNVPYVSISAKTGTAQVGISKNHINSWIIGYWPSDKPRYAFTIMMEMGASTNEIGASRIMRFIIDEIQKDVPVYFE